MTIGDQIRIYRLEAGMSQKGLGEKLGISQQQIAQYESGKRIPKIDTINNIAGALGMGIRRLYPDFTMEEWKMSDTYKAAREKASQYEPLGRDKTRLLLAFDMLNETGKEEAQKRISELSYLPIYTKAQYVHLVPTAVHAIPAATAEANTHVDGVMDD